MMHQPDPLSLPAPGYWGHPTSTVDWCENNYTVSWYIAEFFNTISSASMVILALIGLWSNAKFGARFVVIFASFLVVGIGSIMFHGTLLFPFQMLDELPMCYTSLAMAYSLLEPSKKKKYGWTLPAAMTAYAVATTLVIASNQNAVLQFFSFHLSFGLLQIFVFGSTYHFIRDRSDDAHRIWWTGIRLYVFALVLWLADLNLCFLMNSLPINPQLHAFWHILAGLGCFYTCQVCVLHRLDGLGRVGRTVRLARIIPLVVDGGERLVCRTVC